MLENEKIEEYSRLLKEVDAAKQTVQKLNTELTMLKNQGIEKLKEKGYKSLADAAKIDEEIAKIEAELAYQQKFLDSVRKKLSNERFVANAPEAVVAVERKKEADSLSKIESLTASLNALKNN